MDRGGRPPKGPALVDGLEGSEHAKVRLRALLGTICGELTIHEAAALMEVNPSRVHQIRTRTLQEALTGLEPRKPGPKPQVVDPRDEEIARLRGEIENMKHMHEAYAIRADLALAGAPPPARRPRSKKRRAPRR
jgi:hypothetical protein